MGVTHSGSPSTSRTGAWTPVSCRRWSSANCACYYGTGFRLSCRRIVEALIRGEDSPEILSWKLRGHLRKKEKLVKESLKGCFNEFHRMMLGSLYKHYQFLTAEVASFEERIAGRMTPYSAQMELLVAIPGVERLVAWRLIAELGVDMTVFSRRRSLCQLGGSRPGRERERGEAEEHAVQKRQQKLAEGADTGSVGSVTLQDGLPAGVLPSRQGQARMGESDRRHGP
jgi:transposase